MDRKTFVVLALFSALPGQAPPAFASGPSVLLSAATTGDRYRSQVTFTYDTPVSVTDPSTQVSFHRTTGSVTPLAVAVTGSGTSKIVVTQTGTLAAGAGYMARVLLDDGTSDAVGWKTRAAPVHPTLHAKLTPPLARDAVSNIVPRLARPTLLPVPRPAALVDISAAAAVPHALTNA